jgi:hypothetical protein
MQQLPYLTGIVLISADWVVLNSIVILRNLQYLGDLIDQESHCFFAKSTNGWITKSLWTYYTLVFCAQIIHYRLGLLAHIRDQDMLLIIDGHKSRLNSIATIMFLLNGIDVLVLPALSSHFLQMFDFSVSAPFKTRFKQELDRRISAFAREVCGNRENVQRLRRILAESFPNGFRKGAIAGNIAAGFEATGAVPFNLEVGLSSQLAVDPGHPAILHVVGS